MDRGYDSEAIHRQIREDLHAHPPLRSWNADYEEVLTDRKWLSSLTRPDTGDVNVSRTGSLF